MLLCPGCKVAITRVGELIRYIEGGYCPVITQDAWYCRQGEQKMDNNKATQQRSFKAKLVHTKIYPAQIKQDNWPEEMRNPNLHKAQDDESVSITSSLEHNTAEEEMKRAV